MHGNSANTYSMHTNFITRIRTLALLPLLFTNKNIRGVLGAPTYRLQTNLTYRNTKLIQSTKWVYMDRLIQHDRVHKAPKTLLL
jgi:hypothetical protein